MSGRMRRRLRLASRIFPLHAWQPATALWRVPEAEVVLAHLAGRGRGLDLGCGDGTLATVLLTALPEVRWDGLEIDLRDAATSRRIGPYATVEAASATALPYAAASFDLVFSNSALEHMAELDRVLREVARVLRPGGRFLFTVPTPSLRRNLLWGRALDAVGLSRAAGRYRDHLDRRLAHRNYLSEEQWTTRLSAAGLTVESAIPYLSRREVALWETAANATGGLASLVAGGRHPRRIQQALGIDTPRRRWPGRVVFLLFSPAVAIAALERRPRRFSALYVEARKSPGPAADPGERRSRNQQ